MYEQNLINKAMTRREKITKILDKYWIRRGWIESDESMVEARPLTAKKELADAIMALPIDVPSEEEIDKYAQKEIDRQRKGFVAMNNEKPITLNIWLNTLKHSKRITAKWMRDEILKRNSKDDFADV